MKFLQQFSLRTYSRLLVLFPADLRDEFGTEMAEVFADDLQHECETSGTAGAFLVWKRALWELAYIAVPSHAARPGIAVPALSFAQTVLMLSAELALDAGKRGTSVFQLPTEVIMGIVLVPSIVTAFISLAAISRGKNSTSFYLGLSTTPAEPSEKAAVEWWNSAI